MKTHSTTQSKSSGFYMIEAMAVLIMSAVLMAGVWAIFGTASDSTSVSQESQRLGQLQSAVRNAYISNVNFAAISTQQSVNEKWAPRGFSADTDAWKGPFGLLPASVNVADDSWEALEQAVPNGACVKLVGEEAGSWTDIQVDGQSVTADTALAVCGVDHPGDHTLAFIQFGGVRHGTSLVLPCYNVNPSIHPAPACLS